MKHTTTTGIDYYRVQRWYGARRRKHLWSRTWQAEWNGCAWAPRAYTRRGIERRAGRWHANGGRPDWQIRLHRWLRRNLTQRGEGNDGG